MAFVALAFFTAVFMVGAGAGAAVVFIDFFIAFFMAGSGAAGDAVAAAVAACMRFFVGKRVNLKRHGPSQGLGKTDGSRS